MSQVASQRTSAGATLDVPVLPLVWLVSGAIFLLVRIATIWQAPVASSELAHLSGAWNASVGVDDFRFVPTLFQSLAALLLQANATEVLPRIVAFAATCTVPVAVYRLRHLMGEVPSLTFLLLLAIAAPLVGLGASGAAYGFDVPIALWLMVAATSRSLSPVAAGAFAFLVATAGPLSAVAALSLALVRLAQGRYPGQRALVAIAVGGVAGILAASFGFGWGWQGLTIPPIQALTLALEHEWASASGWQLLLLYAWPVAAAGLAASAYLLLRHFREGLILAGDEEDWAKISLTWFGVSILWCVATLGTGTELPLASLSLSAAAVAAFPGALLLEAIVAANWRRAWLPVLLATFFLTIAGVILIDWARFDNGGPAGSLFVAILLLIAGVTAVALILRRTAFAESIEKGWDAVAHFAQEAWEGDWRNAALAVIGVLAVFALLAFVTVGWASGDPTGRRGEAVVLVALVLVAFGIVAGLLAIPSVRPTAGVVLLIVPLVPLISGAMLVGLSGPSEPMNSPASTFQARNLRDIALAQVADRGGSITVHESLQLALTWPLRDSGDIVVSSHVPDGTAIAIWPVQLPVPAGMVPLEGTWTIHRIIPAPTSSYLRYVRWYADRNYLPMNAETVAVYTRVAE